MPPQQRRFLFAFSAFLFFNGFFVAKVPQATRPELAGVSAAFVLVLWAPGAWALKNWLGWKQASLTLGVLGVFAVGLESLAILTGFPYGHFSYGDKIGLKWFGLVPWTVPFSWPPLVLGALALSRRFFPPRWLLPGAVLFLLLIDGLLDPGAVQQGFWKYQAGGLYYGVPVSNFCGWVLSGLAGCWLFWICSGRRVDIPAALISSLMPIVAFWTSVCFFVGLWIPSALGFALLLAGWQTSKAPVE